MSSSPLRLSIHPRRPGYDVSILPLRLYFVTRDKPTIYNVVYKMYKHNNIQCTLYRDGRNLAGSLVTNRCIGRSATHLAHLSTRETCFSAVGPTCFFVNHAPRPRSPTIKALIMNRTGLTRFRPIFAIDDERTAPSR